MNHIDRSPVGALAWLAAVAALIATGLTALYAGTGGLAATVGLGCVLLGLYWRSRRLVTVGGIALFAGAMAAGLNRAPIEIVIPSVVATVLAWDFGRHAVSIGRQLGHDAPSTRIQVVHVVGTGGVAGISAIVGIGIYQSVTRNQPFVAVFFLLLAAVLLVSAFTDRPSVPQSGRGRP